MVGPSSRRWLKLRRYDDETRTRLGIKSLCGVDEAGRGPLAGPVVAAAVVLPPRVKLSGLDDSKVLDPELRYELAARIRGHASAIGWAVMGPRAIEKLNIHHATLLGMQRAVVRLGSHWMPEYLLIDGRHTIPDVYWEQEALIDGDATSLSIAAASVIAKTIRDRFMERLDRVYPAYGFARHKGYATPEHLAALDSHGPCPWHRFTFSPVRQPSLFPPAKAHGEAAAELLEEKQLT
jgi:ribonuclease HII